MTKFLLIVVGIALSCTIARAQTAGSIDTSFNPGAWGGGSIQTLAVQSDNRLLVGGSFSIWDSADARSLVRLEASGARDTNFAPPTDLRLVSGVWVQPDGKILVTGSFTNVGGQLNTNFVRLLASGALDTSFAGNVNFRISDASFLPDGRILITGAFRTVNQTGRPGVAVIFPMGEIDPSFAPDLSIRGNGRSARVLSDGRFLVSGLSNDAITGLLRLEPSGAVDLSLDLDSPSFFARTPFPIAHTNFLLTSAFELVRVLANNAIDQHYTNGARSTFAEILAVQPDERQLVGGSSILDANGNPSYLLRLFADGKIDPTFQSSLTARPLQLVIRPDGRIVVATFDTLVALHGNDPSGPTQVLWHGTDFDAIHNGPATVKVIRQGSLAGPSTVQWTVTSEAGLQITPAGGQVQFQSGQAIADVTVQLASANNLNASAEFLLQNPQGATLGLNPALRLYVTNQTGLVYLPFQSSPVFPEVHGPLIHSVRREGPLNRTAQIGWRIVGESDPALDFQTASGIAYFSVDEDTVFIRLHTRDNPIPQSSRAYTFQLFPVTPDWTTTSETNLSLTITDNDLPRYPGQGADDSILHSAIDSDGGAFLYGNFHTINGYPRPIFARVDRFGHLRHEFAAPEFSSRITDIIELADKRVLISGTFTNSLNESLYKVLCLLPNGQFDPLFLQPTLNIATTLAVEADGSILLAGYGANFNGTIGATNLGAITRLKPDGAKDTNFFTFTTSATHRIVPVTNGQFYAYGSIYANTNYSFSGVASNTPIRGGVIRFNKDGSLDPTFSATFGVSNRLAGPSRLYAYSDGRVMIGGGLSNVNSRIVPDLVRLSQSGEIDLDFLTNVTKSLGTNFQNLAFDVSPQGKTLVFRRGVGFNQTSSLVLLSPTGQIETTNLIGYPNSYTVAANIRAYPDGRFLVTGPFVKIGTEARFRFAWINPDGLLAPQGSLVVNGFSRAGIQNTLTITSLTAGQYKIQRSSDLVSWVDVTPITLIAGEQSIQFNDAENGSFYRVVR